MRTSTLSSLGLAALVFAGCVEGQAVIVRDRPIYEWERVVVIPKLDAETISSKTRQAAGERGEGATGPTEKEKTQVITGTWLARYRWSPYTADSGRQYRYLSTIEIIFCPFDQADFTRCRVGVAYSAAAHPLGSMQVEKLRTQ